MNPIPHQLLTQTATVKACTGVDAWQKPTYTTYTVLRTHLQNSNEMRRTQQNTEVVLAAILFVDAKRSTPLLDWPAQLNTALAKGGDVKVTVNSIQYTVKSVDVGPDNFNRLHHYEVGLV